MGYVDPGAFGLISQIGYILLFAIVSGFMFFFNRLKSMVKRLFSPKSAKNARPEPGDSIHK
jgi:uncharacterized iron-regulated membrane protein